MRVVLFSVVILLSGIIISLTEMMVEHPFDEANMRTSYFNGCNVANPPLTEASVERCRRLADQYEIILEELMDQE